MSIFRETADASLGWLDLLAARPDAMDKFTVSAAGLRNAVLFYALVVALSVVVDIAVYGVPGPLQFLLSLLATALPLLCLWSTSLAAARLGRRDATALLVTGTYAFAFLMLISLPLTLLFGSGLSAAVLGALLYFFYRSARGAAGFGALAAIGYAGATVGVLVLVSRGLYMLVTPAGG